MAADNESVAASNEQRKSGRFQFPEEKAHEFVKYSLGNGLLRASVDLSQPRLKVLDLGTGSGTWLRDLASNASSSEAQYYGTDRVGDKFLQHSDSNFHYVVQSLTDPYPKDWSNKFTLIHERAVLAFIYKTPIKNIVKDMISLAKPGGWLQLEEINVEDLATDTPATRDFHKFSRAMFRALEVQPVDYAPQLKNYLEDFKSDGLLEEVGSKVIECPIGRRCEDRAMGELGIQFLTSSMTDAIPLAETIDTGLTKEELESLPARYEKEAREIGTVMRMSFAWAKKF